MSVWENAIPKRWVMEKKKKKEKLANGQKFKYIDLNLFFIPTLNLSLSLSLSLTHTCTRFDTEKWLSVARAGTLAWNRVSFVTAGLFGDGWWAC